MTYDEWFFLSEEEYVSNCCGEAVTENTDLCSKCGEHCEEEVLSDEI